MRSLIPNFDQNLVLPPHLGDPTDPSQLSPYPCTSLDLCESLGTTPERRRILEGFLNFRDRLQTEGLTTGFQWLDGSFLENVELRDGRSPRDLDVVTVYWGYDIAFQKALVTKFPEVADPTLAKAKYSLDHYPFDASFRPDFSVEKTRYWISVFSHNRSGVWKGMLRIELDTPAVDAAARRELAKATT